MDEPFKTSLSTHSQVPLIRDASMKSTAFVCKILADDGIPSALVGVVAAAHYGGGLCPLVSLLFADSKIHLGTRIVNNARISSLLSMGPTKNEHSLP